MISPREIGIIYTPEIFYMQRVGGISRYFVELANYLNNAGQHPYLVAGLHRNEYVRSMARSAIGAYLPFGIGPLHRPRVWMNRALFQLTALKHRRAVVHQTYFGETTYIGARPLVLTVYDLIHEISRDRFPGLAGAEDPATVYRRANCARADHLIAISESTKADLVRVFDIDPAKITVVYLGNSFPALADVAGQPQVARELPEGGEYLLYVGSRAGYKNFAGFLEAFALSQTLRQRFKLVCFGGGPFTAGERRQIEALGLVDKVLRQQGDDLALADCYRHARAFIYPSLYEGFGLPVLEAMGQRCPVLCGRDGSLTEVAGNAAAYFDPGDIEDIRLTLETTLNDEVALEGLVVRGSERVKLFSWERCCQETLAVYQRLTSRC